MNGLNVPEVLLPSPRHDAVFTGYGRGAPYEAPRMPADVGPVHSQIAVADEIILPRGGAEAPLHRQVPDKRIVRQFSMVDKPVHAIVAALRRLGQDLIRRAQLFDAVRGDETSPQPRPRLAG